jgi:hypothetical protein
MIYASAISAQTKVIAFKSHSGSMSNFYELVINRNIEMMCHNLGMAPQRIVQEAALDTVIYVNDTTSVMITSMVCTDLNRPYRGADVWSAGIDTVYNDEVWNDENPEKIKNKLKEEFYFKNNMDSVVFIGFPEKTKVDPNKAAGIPVDQNDQNAPPFDDNSSPGMGLPVAIVSVVAIAILIALISWRKSHFKDAPFEEFA